MIIKNHINKLSSTALKFERKILLLQIRDLEIKNNFPLQLNLIKLHHPIIFNFLFMDKNIISDHTTVHFL